MEWPWLEWDWLYVPRQVRVVETGPLAKGAHTTTLERSDDLDLRLDLQVEVQRGSGPPDQLPAGEFVRYEDTPPIGIDWNGWPGKIFGAAQTEFHGPSGKGVAHRVELTHGEGNAAWCTYWLVNVDGHHWAASTDRRLDRNIVRERGGLRPRRNTSGGTVSSSDHLVAIVGDLRFAFGKTRPEGLPKVWLPGFLEFEGGDGARLPTEDEAYAVLEFLSFLTGTEVSCVGRTDYGDDDYWLRAASHARSLQIGHFADVPTANPPLPLTRAPRAPEFPLYVSQLLPAYLRGRDADNFFLALYYYSVARRMPPSLDVSKFSTALDLLSKGYFERHPEKAVYLERTDFERRTRAARDALVVGLTDVEDADVLLRKFDGINQRGENQRREQIFSKLDLRLSAAEEKALRFRNPATHGHKNPGDWVPIIRYGQIMQCLTVRVLLRLLGYDGQYVDYATPGWPSRHISQPCSPESHT